MKILSLTEKSIHISQNTILIDKGEIDSCQITTEENIELRYFFYNTQKKTCKRHFLLGNSVKFRGNGICIKNGDHEIITEVKGDFVHTQLNFLAIATNESQIGFRGIVRVQQAYKKIFARVDQTNILVGKNTRIRGIPQLEVATNDIEGGHSCKIHRIEGEKLFYLKSRGIDEKNAEKMLLESEISKHCDTLKEEEKQIFMQEIYTKIYG